MLEKFYSLSSLENQLLERKHIFLLIQEEDTYLGFCSYELHCEHTASTKLHKIYVLPQTQGKGVGKVLLDAVENIAKENNDTAVFLNVNRNNSAQEFYKHKGYSIIKTEDINIGNGYLMEDFVMEKILN
jgi:diamine N-acetyltransferase